MRSTWMGWTSGTLTLVTAMAWSTAASAHIEIVLPQSRYGPEMIKDAPCGHPDNPPGEAEPHVYQTGEVVTIVVDEFVAHEGHLRVAWAQNDEDFVNVTAFDDFDNFPGVLMDNIIDDAGMKQFVIEVPMPEQECDNCTLQVIQVMYDGNGFQEEDLYYTCADITLLDEVPGADDGEETGAGPDDGGMADTGGDEAADDAAAGDDTTGSAASTGGGNDGTDGGAANGGGDDGGCTIGTRPGHAAWWLPLGLALFGVSRRRSP